LPWNWSIRKRHSPDDTPNLDVIHPLSYLFHATRAVHTAEQHLWDQDLAWMRGCRQGDVRQVLCELRVWQTRLADPPADAGEHDPRELLPDAPAADLRAVLQDDPVSGPQPRPNELPQAPSLETAGDHRLDGIARHGDQPAGQGDRDVLERPGRRRSDPATPRRRPERRRPSRIPPRRTPRLPLHPPPQRSRLTPEKINN